MEERYVLALIEGDSGYLQKIEEQLFEALSKEAVEPSLELPAQDLPF